MTLTVSKEFNFFGFSEETSYFMSLSL